MTRLPAPGMQARLAGTVLALVALGLAVGATVLFLQQVGEDWVVVNDASGIEILVGALVLAYAFSIVGLVVVRRMPANPLGWVYLAIGLFEALNMFSGGYTTWAYHAGGDLPMADLLSWIAVWAWVPAFTLFSTLAILLFPTGRMPSRRWWPVPALTAVSFVLLLLPVAVATWPYRGASLEAAAGLNQPPPPDSVVATAFAIQNVAQFLLLAAMIGSVAGLIVRFRRAMATERQQLKWFAFAAVVDVAILLSWFVISLPPVLAIASGIGFGLALPAAIAVAILRYRLYDIDRLISRTISWGLITASIGGVYFGAVLLLQGEIGGLTHNDVVVVSISTLLAAMAFQPVRRRIQRVVDYRFDRRHANAEASTARLVSRLRSEVDLETIAGDVVGVVDDVVRPRTAALWLRTGPR